jgi:LysM repeat protein
MMRFGIILLALFFSSTVLASGKYTVEEYIEMWKDVAVEQMVEHGIPASITMAQGILESSYGNSYLARKGNNHFGIKCSDWNGPTIYKDDDAKKECFRKYKDARESYKDHSLFLTSRPRYASLFQLDKKDYKSWAKGLKNAGYATNPKYDKLLIDLIERHNLSELDDKGLLIEPKDLNIKSAKEAETRQTRKILINPNRTKYVVAQNGDTFYRIAQEFGLTLRQLYKYNDFPKNKDVLVPGDIVYLMPKPAKAKKGTDKVKVTEDTELWQISQLYGVKVKSLMQLNEITSPQGLIAKGDVVLLR